MNLYRHPTAQAPASVPAAGPDRTADRHARWVGLLLALITVLVYLPSAGHDFLLADDTDYILDNPMVTGGLTWAGFKWAFIGWHAGNWHPLTWLSHQLDCQLFGLHAGPPHLVNVLLHAANTALLFQLWRRLTGTLWPAALVAALFAWHPLHVESVAWVAERKDVLSTFFGLLALLAYARYAQMTPVPSPRSKVFLAWSVLAFALGLLAKPMLVTLPFVMLLLDYWPLRRWPDPGHPLATAGALVGEKWPFFLLLPISAGCTFLAQRPQAMASLQRVPLELRLENALVGAATYLGRTLWPVDLCVFYPLPDHFPAGEVLLAAAVLTAVSLLAWRGRAHRYWLMGWLWFLGMLVPVIGLVQVGDQATADRYTYLPAVGLFVAAAFGLADACARWHLPFRICALAASLLLVAWVAVTEHQLAFWQNTETLFQRAVAVTRNNGGAHLSLAVYYRWQGRPAEARQEYQTAMECYARVTVPVAGGGHRTLAAETEFSEAGLTAQKGAVDDAIEHCRAALRWDPNFVEAHERLASLLDGQGQTTAALAEYQAAAQLPPPTARAHENLGAELAKTGRVDAALTEYQTAARLAPADSRPVSLIGKLALQQGHSAAAIAAFETARRLDPRDSTNLVYLAFELATDPAAEFRNGPRAVNLAEAANQITGGSQPYVLATLAMAYAEAGRFAEARQTVQTALTLATQSRPDLVPALLAQQKLYVANQPCRSAH